MADNRQKRKRFLSARRPILTLDRPNLSLRLEQNQTVKAFPFLILKTLDHSTRRRAMQLSAVGGGVVPRSKELGTLWITVAAISLFWQNAI
jgi:hypothetical protein